MRQVSDKSVKQAVREALRVCYHFRRRWISADEMCKKVVFFCATPANAADVLNAVPEEVRIEVRAFVGKLPTSPQGWSRYKGVMQLDGDQHSMRTLRARCRAATEAVRDFFVDV